MFRTVADKRFTPAFTIDRIWQHQPRVTTWKRMSKNVAIRKGASRMRKTISAISIVVFLSGGALIILTRPIIVPWPTQVVQVVTVRDVAASASNQSNAMARIFETHEKVINYTVIVPVHETHTKEVHYTVMKPVTETREKQVAYTVMRTVVEGHSDSNNDSADHRIVRTVKKIPESKVKSVRYTVCKMVPEQQTKTVTYTTCRMVTETRRKTVQYTTCRFVPAETLQNELDKVNENTIDPMGAHRCLN
jgi:hypothetical protein